MYQALYRKWRPRTFDEVVGQQHITETLKRQVASGRLSHAYLFTGTRGTGKTSCAKILSRAVNCQNPVNGNPCNACPACLGIENGSILDVLELDAASNNGVDQVRALRDEAVYTPAAVRKRVYIVDEVHMLSTPAFNALLKILEEPPEHLLFILATTELHKVPATIKSRCQQFAFKRILPGDIAARLSFVAQQENISLSQDGAALLARLADGGMRDALSLLDQCSGSGEKVTEQSILSTLGLAGNLQTAELLKKIALRDTDGALTDFSRLYESGKEVGALLNELAGLSRDLLLRKVAPKGGESLLTGGYDEATMRGLSAQLGPQRLLSMLALLQKTAADLPRSGNRRTDAEVCLIRLCDESLDGTASGLAARLERLEALVGSGAAFSAPKAEISSPAPRTASEPMYEPAPLPAEEGLPPFDLAPEPLRRAPMSPQKQVRPTPAPKKAPASQDAPSVSGDFWPAVVKAVKGQVPPAAYSFLANPAMTVGTANGAALTIWVESDFVKNMLHKDAVTAPLLHCVETRLGQSGMHVAFSIGKPPAAQTAAPIPASDTDQEEHDRLDDLLALNQEFGDLIVEE